jgi:hypothetical protein
METHVSIDLEVLDGQVASSSALKMIFPSKCPSWRPGLDFTPLPRSSLRPMYDQKFLILFVKTNLCIVHGFGEAEWRRIPPGFRQSEFT